MRIIRIPSLLLLFQILSPVRPVIESGSGFLFERGRSSQVIKESINSLNLEQHKDEMLPQEFSSSEKFIPALAAEPPIEPAGEGSEIPDYMRKPALGVLSYQPEIYPLAALKDTKLVNPLDGDWYAATFQWLRPGNTARERRVVNGDHIKQPPLQSWSPIAGETYYFMVSGIARNGPNGTQERSNIVAMKWPAPGGSASSSSSQNSLPFSLDAVKWLHYSVKDWPVTSNLKVTVNPSSIEFAFDKTQVWKIVKIRHSSGSHDIEVNANPWIFVNVGSPTNQETKTGN